MKNIIVPNVNAFYSEGKLQASWLPVEFANQYRIIVKVSTGEIVLDKLIDASDFIYPVNLESDTFSPVEGQTYSVELSVGFSFSEPETITAENVYKAEFSPKSVRVTANSAIGILRLMKDRLIANVTETGDIVLDEHTLPKEAPGNPWNIFDLICTNMKTSSLVIATTTGPILDDVNEILTIDGQTEINGKIAIVNVVFMVSESFELTFTMKLEMPQEWVFSDSFKELRESEFDCLKLSNTTEYITSYKHNEDGALWDLCLGSNLISTLSISSKLLPICSVQALDLQTVLFGGYIDYSGNSPDFQLEGANSLSDISIILLDLPSMILKNGSLVLNSKRNIDKPNTNTCAVAGKILLDSVERQFEVDIPTLLPSALNLVLEDENVFLSIGRAASLIGGNLLDNVLPDALKNISDMTVKNLSYKFDPNGVEATNAAVNLVSDENFKYIICTTPEIALDEMTFDLDTTYFIDDSNLVQETFRASITSKISLGDVKINIPSQGDWEISILPGEVSITLDALMQFIGGDTTDVLNSLPIIEGLSKDVKLTNVKISVDPFNMTFKSTSFSIPQVNNWNIINGILEFYDLTLDMTATKQESKWSYNGKFSGRFMLGGSKGMELSVFITTPMGDDGWTASISEGFNIPSLGSIYELIHAESLRNLIPEGIEEIGNFNISKFEIVFKTMNVQSVSFHMDTPLPWNIIENKGLVMNYLETDLSLFNGNTDDEKYATGFIRGQLTIAGFQLQMEAKKNAKDMPWIFKLNTVSEIHIPGIKDLAAWMLPVQFIQYIPESFMPFGDGFDITDLSLEFNISDEKLKEIDFSIYNSSEWKILPNYLSLDKTYITAKITNDNELLISSCSIGTSLLVGDAELSFNADKSSPDIEWKFTGTLANKISIDFNELINTLTLSDKLVIPSENWLPVVDLNEANASIIPDDGKFDFDGSVSIDWTIPFFQIKFPITGLGGIIDIQDKTDSIDNYSKGIIYGDLEFSTLKARLGLQLGSTGIDTIFTATLSNEQATAISVTQLSDGLVSGETGATWSELTPSDTQSTGIVFNSAYLYFDKTKDQFFLYGGIANFGQAVLLSQKAEMADQTTGEADQTGYLFAFATSPDFKFSNLYSNLQIIDDILKIREASIVVNTYDIASATELKENIDSIISVSDKPGTIISPITVGNLPEEKVVKGMHIYAALDFGSNLLATLLQLRKMGDVPDVTLYATLAKDSVNSTFKAVLAPFSILDTVEFGGDETNTGIAFEYSANADECNQYKLSGKITFKIFDQEYSFIGMLKSTEKDTQFTVSTPDGKNLLPFNLPEAMTLSNLDLDVIYSYQTETNPTKYMTMDIKGKVSLLENIYFDAAVYTIDGVPVLAEAVLTENFSVGSLFNSLIPGKLWPTDFVDLVFLPEVIADDGSLDRKSRVYYYQSESDPNEHFKDYESGFNIESTITLTILASIDIVLTAKIDKGFVASAGLTQPIDVFVLQLASTNKGTDGKYIGSPTLNIDTTKSNPEFGFSAGLNFFQTPFVAATIMARKLDKSNVMEIKGNLKSGFAIDVFGELNLDFSYSQTKGFIVDNWPSFELAEDIIDFMKEIKKIYDKGGSGCGALVDFASNVTFTQDYSISPSFSTREDGLYFVLTGKYFLKLYDTTFVTIAFPTVDFKIPNDIDFDNLLVKVIECIGDASADFVMELFNNPSQIAAFLAVVFADKAVNIAAKFLCRGLIGAAPAAAAAAAGAAVAGAIAAAGGVLTAAAAATAIAAALAIIVEAIGDDPTPPGPEPVDPKPEAPEIWSFKYSETEDSAKVTEMWGPTEYASGYEFQMLRPDNTLVGKLTQLEDYQTKISVDVLDESMSAGTYTGQVRSIRGEYKSAYGSAIIEKLKAPSNIALSYSKDEDNLVISWDCDNAINNYNIVLFRDDQKLFSDIGTEKVKNYDAKTLVAGSYTANVRANGNDDANESYIPSDFSVSPVPITRLVAPVVNIIWDAESWEFNVSWQNVLNNAGYYLEIFNAENDTVISTANIDKDLLIYTVDLTKLGNIPSGTYKVRVKAIAGQEDMFDSQYGESQFISYLAKPVNIRLAQVESCITVVWDNDSKAKSHMVKVLYGTGAELAIQPDITIDGNQATIVTRKCIDQTKAYQIKVSAASDNVQSVWSDPVSTLTIPQNLNLVNVDNNIKASWNTVTGATKYILTVLDDKNVQLAPQPKVTFNGSEAIIDASTMTNGKTYYVFVRASNSLVEGPESRSTSIVRINADVGGNLALNKPAAASSIEQELMEKECCTAGMAVDGNSSTRWSSEYSSPQWIYVDLGQSYNINRVKLSWEVANARAYKIQVSNDSSNWTDVYSTTNGKGGIEEISFTPTNARYVRMYGISRGTFYGYSIYEFEVYSSNLALNKSAVASSIENGGHTAGMAVDGDSSTRWTSEYSDPQWIYVDLGQSYNINRVKLSWEAAYAKSYEIQVSNDSSNWTDVYSTTKGKGGIEEISFTPTNARYVRMYGTERTLVQGVELRYWGYALYEFEVYS